MNNLSIQLSSVSKRYKLFPSYLDNLAYLFRLDRFGIKYQAEIPEHYALRDINLRIYKGQKIGIIGRNGSGKTTLLKLICQALEPTSGKVSVSGNIQALLNIGLGFHMEDTGYKNIQTSLSCSGLFGKKLKACIDDIKDFCELGNYLYQPMKTYSLGMQSRLMFATATAVTPEILIIDEMLGAGDAYFLAKSKKRITALINSGCTVIVVSHSMSQILELCDRAIWIDKGEIRMNSDTFSVVKSYEEYLYGPIQSLEENENDPKKITKKNNLINKTTYPNLKTSKQFSLIPIPSEESLPERHFSSNFKNIAPGGLSRWDPEVNNVLDIIGFKIISNSSNQIDEDSFTMLSDVRFSITLKFLKKNNLSMRYGLVIQDSMGKPLATFFSPKDDFSCDKDTLRLIDLDLKPCLLGPGNYVVGISIHPFRPITSINQTPRFALLSRSFCFSISVPDSYAALGSTFVHPCEWTYGDI
tara:strand:- start:1582 stop:2994 length:1413 start_codon:yes stop_codon:yes gene_type:complete